MKLSYTTEVLISPDNIPCTVLDTSKVDFSSASEGRKSAETLVCKAKGGEKLITKNTSGQVESVYTTQAGDAIFINLHNSDDRYVPPNKDGTRWQFDELQSKGYAIVGSDAKSGEVLVKSATSFKILKEAIEKPTCIKDAWGPGQHQFLFAGATLKLNDNGSVTGIDKSSFDNTWEVLPAERKAAQKKTSFKM